MTLLRYVGDVHWAVGCWVGLELDAPMGDCDGAVCGVRYFDCPPNRGAFARASALER